MGQMDRRRHQRLGLAAGISEHDALVAGALILVAEGIDSDGDVGRLLVQMNLDIGGLPMESVLLIADVADRVPGKLLQHGAA